MQVQKFYNIKFDNIIYDISKRESKYDYIYTRYKKDGKTSPILLEFPYLYSHNGIEVDSDNEYICLYLLCKNRENTKILNNFFRILELKFIDDAKKYKKEWFGQKDRINYKSFIRECEEEGNLSLHNLILFNVLKNKNFRTKISTKNKNSSILNNENNSFFVKSLIEIKCLYINKEDNTFGINFRLHSLDFRIVKPLNNSYLLDLHKYLNLNNDNEESEVSSELDDGYNFDKEKNILSSDSDYIDTISTSDDFNNIMNNLSDDNSTDSYYDKKFVKNQYA